MKGALVYNGTMQSVTPLTPIVDADCRVLILGSHPSVISKEMGFYYANPHNRFWRVLSEKIGEDLTQLNAEGKTRLLLAHHIALSDVVASCTLSGSADATIRDVVPSDIEALLAEAPIGHIFINGKTAYRYFAKYFPHLLPLATVLPSTSPANAQWSYDALLEAWQAVKDALID